MEAAEFDNFDILIGLHRWKMRVRRRYHNYELKKPWPTIIQTLPGKATAGANLMHRHTAEWK